MILSDRKLILLLRIIWKGAQAAVQLAVHEEPTTRLALFSKQSCLYRLNFSLPCSLSQQPFISSAVIESYNYINIRSDLLTLNIFFLCKETLLPLEKAHFVQ